jgi:LPS export ABC transporter protein LptC
MNIKRIKLTIVIAIGLIGAFVFVTAWTNVRGRKIPSDQEAISKIAEGTADVRLEKIRFVEDKHGEKTWELEAKAIQQYQGQDVMVIEDVKVTIFTKDGKAHVISGKEGKVHQDSRNVELIGNVQLTSAEGYQLRTQSVSYRHAEKRVATSDPVEIEGDQIRVLGRGMVVDLEAKTFKILGQVKTQWKGGVKG